jgi:hypothetical protein
LFTREKTGESVLHWQYSKQYGKLTADGCPTGGPVLQSAIADTSARGADNLQLVNRF